MLPLSPAERSGLVRMWPTDCLHNVRNLVLQHEEYHLSLDL